MLPNSTPDNDSKWTKLDIIQNAISYIEDLGHIAHNDNDDAVASHDRDNHRSTNQGKNNRNSPTSNGISHGK